MQSIIIGPNQAGQRFDKFLHKYLPKASTGFLYKMLRKKNITLNGKKAEGHEMLQLNDEVRMFFSEDTYTMFSGRALEESANANIREDHNNTQKVTTSYEQAFKVLKGIKIIYEDPHVLILNKPAGILTQKASDKDLSLNEWMIGYLLHNNILNESELYSFKPSVVNRLDRNTSGLVLCGKTLAGSQALSKLIHDRCIRKFYRTIAVGQLTDITTIKGFLTKDHYTNKVSVIKTKRDGSDYIETAYEPLKYNRQLTYLEVELITGKTHQIRAHLASIHHPLIGDFKYGNPKINSTFKADYNLSYQLLHAYRLEFPVLTGTLSGLSRQQFVAPLPDLFENILSQNFR